MDRSRTVALLLIAVSASVSGCLGPVAEEDGARSATVLVRNTDDVPHTVSVAVEKPNGTKVYPLRLSAGSTETADTVDTDDAVEYSVTARVLGGPERTYRWRPDGERNLTVRYDGDEIRFDREREDAGRG